MLPMRRSPVRNASGPPLVDRKLTAHYLTFTLPRLSCSSVRRLIGYATASQYLEIIFPNPVKIVRGTILQIHAAALRAHYELRPGFDDNCARVLLEIRPS